MAGLQRVTGITAHGDRVRPASRLSRRIVGAPHRGVGRDGAAARGPAPPCPCRLGDGRARPRRRASRCSASHSTAPATACPDGTIWGGELLVADYRGFRRAGHLSPVAIPGGERRDTPARAHRARTPARGGRGLGRAAAVRARRAASGSCACSARMLETGAGCTTATSAGRLFDAVAAIAGVRQDCTYEGQAAIELEAAAARGGRGRRALPVRCSAQGPPLVLDSSPMLRQAAADVLAGAGPEHVGARFHAGLAAASARAAVRAGRAGALDNRRAERWSLRQRAPPRADHRASPGRRPAGAGAQAGAAERRRARARPGGGGAGRRRESAARDEIPRRVPGPGSRAGTARGHRAHRHAAVGDHGGLRRADPLDHPQRDRPAAARPGGADPRPGVPGLRDAAGDDRPGARDRRDAGRHLLLVRRHAARPGQRARPVRGPRARARTCASSTRRWTPSPSPRRTRTARSCSSRSGSRRRHPRTRWPSLEAERLGLANFSMLVSHVLVPPAIEAILRSPSCRVQAFLAAGHVCTVMGTEQYAPLAREHGVPIVVTGFEPLDVLEGVRRAVHQLEEGRSEVENAYARAVRDSGNLAARSVLEQVFQETDRTWRGIGAIPASGWRLRDRYAALRRRAALRRLLDPDRGGPGMPQRRGPPGADQAERMRVLRPGVHAAHAARGDDGLGRGRLRRLLPLPRSAPGRRGRRRWLTRERPGTRASTCRPGPVRRPCATTSA